MDEVENPALPAAGESSPTLRPIEEDEDSGDVGDGSKPGIDTVEADGILENDESKKTFADEQNTNLYVSNLPKSMNEHELVQLFHPHKVCSSRILRNKNNGHSLGVGFARFKSRDSCEEVIKTFNNHTIDASGEELQIQIRFADTPPPQSRIQLPARPQLKREASGPPPQQPPPAPPDSIDYTQEAPDSLTLADLKRIRSTFPNAQTPQKQQLLDYDEVYDFEYQDAQSLPVELEEWFNYSDEEQVKLKKCKAAFNEAWRATEDGKADWLDVTEDVRRAFITKKIDYLSKHHEENEAAEALMVLTYIALGIWEETAGRQEGCSLAGLFPGGDKGGSRLSEYASSGLQLQWIIAMIDTLHSCNGLKVVYGALRHTTEGDFKPGWATAGDQPVRNDSSLPRAPESMEMWCGLTLMYLFVEVARATGGENGQKLKKDIVALEPNLLSYLTSIIAKLRWDEAAPVPLTKMLLLAWKTVLVTIGGITDVEDVKASLRVDQDEKDIRGQPVITASPLDYHLFRQEINSKYPAYQPPAPIFPIEPENNSILPPLKHRRPSFASPIDAPFNGVPSVGSGSIMHQPVHIATPAPSPPPSPGGPGKAGKKQNYQTNNMFPLLYPPLETSSNDLGGKGSTELQDALVGRKWEGSDIPASILEAAELFAKRMRATRAMKQLWEARVDYMKYERGWKPSTDQDKDAEGFEVVEKLAPDETAEQGQPLPQTDEQRRLDAVNDFYRDSLPHLQSVVIVLLKAEVRHLEHLVIKSGQNNLQAGIQFNDTNGINGSAKPVENGITQNGDGLENTADELDHLRSHEIAGKAISAILILLLKWFKVSRILQYEYMTQLILDSNYTALMLKMWQAQDVGRACHYRLETPELNFFYFCRENSRQGLPKSTAADNGVAGEESEDEALPPAIKLKRDSPENPLSPSSPLDFSHPPEVDELGYPQTPLPSSPIKSYSYRNMFATINYLRILQKVTRRKTHRALLLVSFKSSGQLKKSLKIPVHLLRYYTLKLFKTQVPFCGRKWRQSNMKIITAVWLSVPAELRDDWLSGGGGGMGGACVGDVDGTVDDALPLEQSLRALTHWWNVRNYPDALGVQQGMLDEEMDYFTRELEKMDLGNGLPEEGGVQEDGVDDGGAAWSGPIEGY